MAVKSNSRKNQSEARRCSILQAARCVFARQGYASTVVDDIAAQAGIAKGTLYLYFPSKEQIYLAALLEDARRLDAVTRTRIEEARSWQEKLAAYLQVRLDYLEAHPDFLRIFLAEFRSMMVRGVPLQSELHQLMRDGEGQLAQIFAAAIARGEIRPVDPELAALTVSDLTRGLIERRLLGWSRPSGPCEVQFALDLLFHSLAVGGNGKYRSGW